jgi:hypothetical protein
LSPDHWLVVLAAVLDGGGEVGGTTAGPVPPVCGGEPPATAVQPAASGWLQMFMFLSQCVPAYTESIKIEFEQNLHSCILYKYLKSRINYNS